VAFELGEVIERVDAAEFAGVDQAPHTGITVDKRTTLTLYGRYPYG
jgi:hypothetical protein